MYITYSLNESITKITKLAQAHRL